MKKITIPESIQAIEAINSISQNLSNEAQYEVACVKYILEKSIELARPFVTGEEKKDQWLADAKTLPFEPLVLKRVLAGVGEINPQTFRHLKRLS